MRALLGARRFPAQSIAAIAALSSLLTVSCAPSAHTVVAAAPSRVAVPPPSAVASEAAADVLPVADPARHVGYAGRAVAHRVAPTPTARIVIPRIGLNAATFEGIDPESINRGPSHWPGTAAPGELGNAVFAGHRVTFTRPFYDIDLLRVGDRVIFEQAGATVVYAVNDYFVVDEDAMWIANTTDAATVTLFSCHPKHSYRQRYVVTGELVSGRRATPPTTSGEPGPSDNTASGDEPEAAAPAPDEPPTTATTRRCIVCIGHA